ncbi:unnamed protein product [Callosobruchus maculatus]|uniref:Uncharacterized protein n=1 Tax=Callosobruchus maculatus TaxID=64391 RepID=A0A653CD63_CALMS|nr:unnamed protein product [Callosobruchus maculatus]
MDIMVNSSEEAGLSFNMKKTKIMIISKKMVREDSMDLEKLNSRSLVKGPNKKQIKKIKELPRDRPFRITSQK